MARTKGSLPVEIYMKKYKSKTIPKKISIKELSKGFVRKYDINKMEEKLNKMLRKNLMDLNLLKKLACKTTCWMEYIKVIYKENYPGYYENEYSKLNRIRNRVLYIYRKVYGGKELDQYPELIEPVDKYLDEEGGITLHFN